MLPRLLLLAALAAPVPALAAPRRAPVIKKKPAADPLAAWLEADDLVADGDPAAALARLRGALEMIRRSPEASPVKGPEGDTWTRAEALHRYTMRAAEVASLVSWREAAVLFETAVKLAPDRDARQAAELQLEAARSQIEAGQERAPAFLGDDPARLVERKETAPLRVEPEGELEIPEATP